MAAKWWRKCLADGTPLPRGWARAYRLLYIDNRITLHTFAALVGLPYDAAFRLLYRYRTEIISGLRPDPRDDHLLFRLFRS